jgi:ATP-dependent helicase HrpB
VRLWSETEHSERPVRELPEVKRLELSEIVLTLKASGVEDLRRFRWLESPGESALLHAEELLLDLGALEQSSDSPTSISPLGRRMLAFPVHPRYARMLFAAQDLGCVYHACLVAALTQGRDLLVRNVSRDVANLREDLFGTPDGTSDFFMLMQAYEYAAKNQFRIDPLRSAGIHGVTARQVGPLHEQFLGIARQEGLDIRNAPVQQDALRRCILIGFSDRVARRIDMGQPRCELVHGRRGTLARESVVRDSSLMVIADVQEIGGKPGDVNTVLSLATAVEMDWLQELFPRDMFQKIHVTFDTVMMRVRAEEQMRFRDLVVAARRFDPPPAEAAAQLLAEEVLAGRLQLSKWDHAVEQWILRLNRLAEWCPELGLPPIESEDRRHIVEQVCHGAVAYKDLKEREVKPTLRSWLEPWQQDLLDKHAPERVTLSNGRTPRVTYEAQGPPFISLRIQELFDVAQTPRIAQGRVLVSVHILAPSMRPVQVTQDLANFWREHYPGIRSELRRKYPKHEWR